MRIFAVTIETDYGQPEFWISYWISKPSWAFLDQGKKEADFVRMLYRTKWLHCVHSFEGLKKVEVTKTWQVQLW